jgi:hypothetical protein
MIAPAQKATTEDQNPSWHAAFLALLPAIRKEANYAFRGLKPEAKEDAVEEVVANSCLAFARLVELGKADIAYASVLARFGIQQYRDGRRVGNRLRIGDVLSPYAQKKKGIVVESLDKFDKEENAWQEAIVEDDRTPIPDQVAFRIDFPAWLATFPERDRRIAESLAIGERTSDVANRFHVSPGRISQMRREFWYDWRAFHGELNREETERTIV